MCRRPGLFAFRTSRETKPGSNLWWTRKRGEASEQKIAQAHAHYADGIVHDMNDETEAALADYCIAASWRLTGKPFLQ